MKTNETPKIKTDETGFLASLVVLELLILPALPLGKYGGGIAMLVCAVVGLGAYGLCFKERLRARGQLRSILVFAALSFVIGTATAGAVVWLR